MLKVDRNYNPVPSVNDWSVPAQVTLSGSSVAITPPENTVEIWLSCTANFYINDTSPAAATDFALQADIVHVLPIYGVDGQPFDGSAVSFYVYGASGTLTILYLKA